MKKNIFPFIPDENLSDIEILLKFIRQPIPLDAFLKKFPKDILNAKLEQLEFDNQELEQAFFNISLKARWKNKQIRLTNELVSPLGISITDKSQLIEKLNLDKFLQSELTFKESLKKIIDSHNKNIISLHIDSVINLMQEKSLSLHEGREGEEQVKIRLFFIFLKIFIQRTSLSENKHSFSFAESLINSATCLTRLFDSDIKNIIFCLNDNLTFAKEESKEKAYKREQQETNISKMVFAYDQVLTKLNDLAPSSNQKDINQLLDSIFENSVENKILSKYNFFKQAYFLEKGFACYFGDYNGYDLVQTCQKKLDRLNYQNFIQLIEELTTHANKKPEIMDLAVTLKEIIGAYFHSLLHNSVFKEENKENLDATAFKNFESTIKNKISNFQKNYLCPIEILGILNKILNTLAKCAPKFFISKEKRISFFQKKMPEVKLLDRIKNTVPLMKI